MKLKWSDGRILVFSTSAAGKIFVVGEVSGCCLWSYKRWCLFVFSISACSPLYICVRADHGLKYWVTLAACPWIRPSVFASPSTISGSSSIRLLWWGFHPRSFLPLSETPRELVAHMYLPYGTKSSSTLGSRPVQSSVAIRPFLWAILVISLKMSPQANQPFSARSIISVRVGRRY